MNLVFILISSLLLTSQSYKHLGLPNFLITKLVSVVSLIEQLELQGETFRAKIYT